MSVKTKTSYKILLLGDQYVGKTSILLRFAENKFSEKYMSTVGLDYRTKNIKLNNGKEVNVQLWDTAGQEVYRSITRNYYKNANGILLVFDKTSLQSYQSIQNWVHDIREESKDSVKIVLIANKMDDKKNIVVSTEDGKLTAEEFNLKYFETSAKTGENVDLAINSLIEEIDKNYISENEKGKKLGFIAKKFHCCQ